MTGKLSQNRFHGVVLEGEDPMLEYQIYVPLALIRNYCSEDSCDLVEHYNRRVGITTDNSRPFRLQSGLICLSCPSWRGPPLPKLWSEIVLMHRMEE